MKYISTVLAGALSVGALMLGCSDDEAPQTPAAGGTGGTASGGRGGSSGSGGSGATGGSAGSTVTDARADVDAGQCRDNDPAELQECKRIGNAEGTCSSLVNCSCDKCACLLAACEADPACLALRKCALEKHCCSPSLVPCGPEGCCTGDICSVACMAEFTVAASGGGSSLILALDLDNCVYQTHDAGVACTPCPFSTDAGDAAAGDARDSATGG